MSSKEGDAQLFEIMKSQMGMDPAKCDPVTLDLLRQKFFGKSSVQQTKEQKVKKSKQNNIIDKSGEDKDTFKKNRTEADIHLTPKVKKIKKKDGKETTEINPKDKQLDFSDIFEQLDKNNTSKDAPKEKGADVINTTKLKKQLKNLKRDASKELSMPISGHKKQKIMREQGNELNKKLVGKYLPQVKVNREEEQHDFTTADKLRTGGAVNLKSIQQMASNATEASATSDMEKKIQAELRKAGLQSEKDLVSAEFNALSGIDAAQLEQRYSQLSKMKHLLFRQEHKNKRIKKIKSKLYHKLKKRDKQREEGKLKSYLEEVDPDAAAEFAKAEELLQAEERLRLRHGGHKKWARDMRRFKGKMEDKETREQYHEMTREKNRLKDRQKRTTKATKDLGSDYDSDDSENDSSDEESGDEGIKKKAVKQIKEALSGEENSDEEEQEGSSEESDDEVKMEFGKKSEKKKDKKEATGIMNMKFMKTAESNKKERLQNEAKMLVEQIEEDQEQGSDDNAGGLFGASSKFGEGLSSKFGGKIESKAPKIDTEEVLKAAQQIFEKQKENPIQEQEYSEGSSDEDNSDEEEDDMSFTSNEDGGNDEEALLNLINDSKKKEQKEISKKTESQKKQKKESKGPIEVNFNDQSLEKFNTKSKKLIKADDEDGEEKPFNMKKLFVTEEENAVYDQFEKEKEAEIEGELGDAIPTAEIKKGWNEWAGQGARINEKKHTDRVKKASDVRKGKIEEMRKKRADFKMRGVILNTEERDKKFAQKYLLKELPHPYNNIEQYKKVMDNPLGKEWNTLQSHKRLIQPDVLTKAGEIIKPLRFKKDIAPKTMDALVQHRQNKREKRPAAKF